jgi:hypothetical protein
MAPHDRDQAERDNKRWMSERTTVPYANPFSYAAILARHHPEQLTTTHKGDPGYPGY